MPMRAAVLERLKQKLLQKRRALINEVREKHTSDFETGGEGLRDSGDQATTAYTKEFLLSLGDADLGLLKEIDAALVKIRQKKYGVCEWCGKPIGEKRLDVLPFVRFCIPCQEEEERKP